MMSTKSQHVIWAGLAAGMAIAVPARAQALTMFGTDVAPLVPPFLLGCAAGAAVASVGFVVSAVVRTHSDEDEPSDSGESTSVTLRVLEDIDDDVPGSSANGGGHFATSSVESDAPRHLRRVVRDSADLADEVRVQPVTEVPIPQEDDLEAVATSYIGKHRLGVTPVTTRKLNVASVLRERFGSDMMDGLPVIARADGTVGDVGTDWWNARLGESVPDVPSIMPEDEGAPGTSAAVSATAPSVVASSSVPASTSQTAAENSGRRDMAVRAGEIARRLSSIDQGVFPVDDKVHREESHADMWERALAALDEHVQVASQAPGLALVENAIDSIDEPDGLEPATSFIPFRAPAGHPEVKDTESYVDYLVRDELAHNHSKVVRDGVSSASGLDSDSDSTRTNYEHLRVVEGGSGVWPVLDGTNSAREA